VLHEEVLLHRPEDLDPKLHQLHHLGDLDPKLHQLHHLGDLDLKLHQPHLGGLGPRQFLPKQLQLQLQPLRLNLLKMKGGPFEIYLNSHLLRNSKASQNGTQVEVREQLSWRPKHLQVLLDLELLLLGQEVLHLLDLEALLLLGQEVLLLLVQGVLPLPVPADDLPNLFIFLNFFVLIESDPTQMFEKREMDNNSTTNRNEQFQKKHKATKKKRKRGGTLFCIINFFKNK